jgi:hypothetical protein
MNRLVGKDFTNVVFAAAVLMVSAAPVAAQVYKQVDAQGKVTYTDQLPKDGSAEKIEMPATNAMPAVEKKAEATAVTGLGEAEGKPAFTGYTRFEMTSPEHGEILGWDVTTASLVAEMSPPLQEGHTIQFYLDAQPLGQPGSTMFRLISSLERGTHQAYARVRDARGKTLRNTNAVTFEVRRHIDEDNTILDPDLYPYDAGGARGPRGARSAGGADEPVDADNGVGASAPPAVRGPERRPRTH